MIFRTGSVLIVGKCIESELIEIYDFLKELLENECNNIIQNTDLSNFTVKSKKKVAKKIKKKITLLNNV